MSKIILETRSVRRVLPGTVEVTLIDGIDASFAVGDFVAVTGPSGSGKSSYLYLLGLLDQPTEGEVLLAGRPTSGLSSSELASLRLASLGFVFQFHFLLPEFTVLENVMIPMRRREVLTEDALKARAAVLLGELGLSEASKKYPDQLSGGQRQRVAIARALANDPDVVLADEPTGNLDSKNAEVVFDIFTRLAREKGKTVIVVTHDPALAARTDRVLRIVDGRLTPLAARQC